MSFQALNMFLSEANIRRHEEYLNSCRLKLSILDKSDVGAIRRDNGFRKEKAELLWQIRSHECFFDSFSTIIGKTGPVCEKMKYDLYCECMGHEYGFLYIFRDRGIKTKFVRDNREMPNIDGALCIDLYEHAYFLDYGFNKDKFLKNAISYLDLERILDN